MIRTNTVNFLQIENSLRDAVAECIEHPEAPYAKHYLEPLQETVEVLESVSNETDRLYLAWRASEKDKLLSAKALWLAFKAVRTEMVEYDLEPQPKGSYNYWEDDVLSKATGILLDQIETLDAEEYPEVEEWKTKLQGLLRDLQSAYQKAEQALRTYQKAAPLRRQAIYKAMAMMDEFQEVYRDYRVLAAHEDSH